MPGIPQAIVDAANKARQDLSSEPVADTALPNENDTDPGTTPAHQKDLQAECAQLELRLKNMRAARDGRLVLKDQRIAELEAEMAALKARPTLQSPTSEDDELPVADTAQQQQQQPQFVDPTKATNVPVNSVAEKRFFRELDGKRPNWREYNSQTAFLNWLSEIEPLDDIQRQEILDGYIAALDVNGLIGMLDQFDALQQASASALPTSHPNAVGGSQALASQQASDSQQGLVEYWKQSEIKDIMNKKILLRKKGQYHDGHPEGKKVREAELSIRKAISENRVLIGQ